MRLRPSLIVNLYHEKVHFKRSTCVGTLVPQDTNISEITIDSVELSANEGYKTKGDSIELFITSPTDINVHGKTNLLDADVEKKYKKELEKLCDEFQDIFLNSLKDIGCTPLIEMDINTGNIPMYAKCLTICH